MIYLIGGTARVGKSTLARLLLERTGASFLPLDALSHALHQAHPELTIRTDGWDAIPDRLFPFLRELVRTTSWLLPAATIEGDTFRPRHGRALQEEFTDVRCVFMGARRTTLAEITGFGARGDWVKDLPPEEQEVLPDWLMEKSRMFEAECLETGVPYVDTSDCRPSAIEQAYALLVNP